MTVTADIVVVGGGIIGMLTAREFSLAGARTALIERNTVGREASWAGGGILFPLYPWKQPETILSVCLKSLEIYPQLAQDLYQDTGTDIELVTSGMLICDLKNNSEVLTWCKTRNIRAARASKSEIQRLAPKLNPEICEALWLPNVCQIRNPNLIKALYMDLVNRGVSIHEGQEVTQLANSDNRIQYLKTKNKKYVADHYVLSAGAWTQKLIESRPDAPTIVPAKGEMLLYKTKPGLLQRMILREDMYLIPRQDGHILVGSTLEYSGYDKTPTQTAKRTLHNFAVSVFPPLRNYAIEKQWAGLRPACTLGIPIIGRDPTIENLSYNCGHFRNGLNMAPASAQMLVDLVFNRATPLSAAPYAFDAERGSNQNDDR